jgi:hypothetical protein
MVTEGIPEAAPERLWVRKTEYVRADVFPAHIDATFKSMQDQIHALKRRVAELEITEHCGRVEL